MAALGPHDVTMPVGCPDQLCYPEAGSGADNGEAAGSRETSARTEEIREPLWSEYGDTVRNRFEIVEREDYYRSRARLIDFLNGKSRHKPEATTHLGSQPIVGQPAHLFNKQEEPRDARVERMVPV